MANRWAPLATVTDDPKPQRPSKKQPAAAQNGASDGSGVPPASINRAAAAAFPSPLPGTSKSSDFPALASNPAPVAQMQPHSSGVTTQAYAAAASQRAPVTPAGAAVPADAQHPVSQPKTASSKADWGYLSSERQKDKVRSTGAPLKSASEELERLNKEAFTLLACNDHQRMSLFRKWRSLLQPVDAVNFPPPVFDDGNRKLTVVELFSMSAVTRCIVQSFLKLPASDDEDTLLLLPSLFVGSAAQLRALLQGLRAVSRCYANNPSEASAASFSSSPPPALCDAICSAISPIAQKKQHSSGQSLDDQLRHINSRISDLLERLQTIDATAQQERASGQAMALVNTDSGARVSVTHSLQQLGKERMELMRQLAAAPPPPPSSDVASDFQVIESHLHAVVAKVQAQQMEEERLRTQLLARKSASAVEEEPWVAQVLSRHDEQQRRLQQLKDEARAIERRLREAQAAVAEQESAMRAEDGERHRAELRRQECSRQWAKDDDKLAALQRSIQNMAAAQLDFEGLFVSLKTQAHAGLAPGHSGGEMTLADATREEMGFIAEHLKSILAGKKLVMRRLRFCNSKINSLQSELNEALQLNMSDVVTELQRSMDQYRGMKLAAETQFGAIVMEAQSHEQQASSINSHHSNTFNADLSRISSIVRDICSGAD